jgi:CBS domain-containing protein
MTTPAIATFRFPPDTCIPQAQPRAGGKVSLESPALEVMTDLAVVKAETIEPDTALAQAEKVMIHRGVRSLFVTSIFPCIEGLVTAADLIGDKPMRVVGLRQIRHQDLRVADVMTELKDLDAIDYDELKKSDVGNVVATFEKLKCTHVLVVQSAKLAGPARIRGVISVTQVERQLGKSILTLA